MEQSHLASHASSNRTIHIIAIEIHFERVQHGNPSRHSPNFRSSHIPNETLSSSFFPAHRSHHRSSGGLFSSSSGEKKVTTDYGFIDAPPPLLTSSSSRSQVGGHAPYLGHNHAAVHLPTKSRSEVNVKTASSARDEVTPHHRAPSRAASRKSRSKSSL